MNVSLQPTTKADLNRLMPLMAEFYYYFDYPFDEPKHRVMVADFLANPHLGSIWLIRLDDQDAGYLALTNSFIFEFGGREARVDELYVREAYRRSGLGRFALEQIQQKAPQLGLVSVTMQVEKYNDRARKLYESLGFVDLERATLSWFPTKS
ncbi:GNAT family N-acetyltransferase [Spirosoma sp. KUDC1026]|uniref:GNAT family N-acetyltransferase n=1 Tax=Spirosoma sp. KUDC1026 TaxID=2745947 RepID=UPI00159BE94D|nr:GNAT family N-acetyltransferase [Spirosoma sp. KUDC1026]QKZ14013.1 GNAT family N-acetyltransferase [Spirosoma sp. KUDC1026]